MSDQHIQRPTNPSSNIVDNCSHKLNKSLHIYKLINSTYIMGPRRPVIERAAAVMPCIAVPCGPDGHIRMPFLNKRTATYRAWRYPQSGGSSLTAPVLPEGNLDKNTSSMRELKCPCEDRILRTLTFIKDCPPFHLLNTKEDGLDFVQGALSSLEEAVACKAYEGACSSISDPDNWDLIFGTCQQALYLCQRLYDFMVTMHFECYVTAVEPVEDDSECQPLMREGHGVATVEERATLLGQEAFVQFSRFHSVITQLLRVFHAYHTGTVFNEENWAIMREEAFNLALQADSLQFRSGPV
ncbi:hypothetical protein FE257_000438 [Aspergillus nanangensis]|uniref:Uncharacterized protein n=1 Tax=Aspergillus nanangensis TaxID=2582783 RepID=A0AAD4CUB0_ASPNN|nr:hypothetical protein FE257_000438 [Aspergillus nanangensis]